MNGAIIDLPTPPSLPSCQSRICIRTYRPIPAWKRSRASPAGYPLHCSAPAGSPFLNICRLSTSRSWLARVAPTMSGKQEAASIDRSRTPNGGDRACWGWSGVPKDDCSCTSPSPDVGVDGQGPCGAWAVVAGLRSTAACWRGCVFVGGRLTGRSVWRVGVAW